MKQNRPATQTPAPCCPSNSRQHSTSRCFLRQQPAGAYVLCIIQCWVHQHLTRWPADEAAARCIWCPCSAPAGMQARQPCRHCWTDSTSPAVLVKTLTPGVKPWKPEAEAQLPGARPPPGCEGHRPANTALILVWASPPTASYSLPCSRLARFSFPCRTVPAPSLPSSNNLGGRKQQHAHGRTAYALLLRPTTRVATPLSCSSCVDPIPMWDPPLRDKPPHQPALCAPQEPCCSYRGGFAHDSVGPTSHTNSNAGSAGSPRFWRKKQWASISIAWQQSTAPADGRADGGTGVCMCMCVCM